MSALPAWVSPALYVSKIDTKARRSVFVECDFQSLHEHMTTCASRRRGLAALRRVYEATRALMLLRIVTSVLCAVALGLISGSVLRLIFPV